METDGSTKRESSASAESLKADLKEKLMGLIHHPGTPSEDKDKLLMIVDKLVEK